MERLRQTDVKFVKGVGPKMAELLEKELGIRTCYDLLYHFPNQYVDRSKFYSIAFHGCFVPISKQGQSVHTLVFVL